MLEKETQIETKGREQNLYQIMMQMCLCVHILLMGFFACMHIWFMVTVNILSVLLYCFGVARIKTTKKISQWLLAIFSEILIHCVLCNLIIGWGYGFSLYVLLMTPITYNVCCFSKNGKEGYRHANILSVASLIIVLTSCVAGGSANRIVGADAIMTWMCGFNLTVSAVCLIFFSLYFVRSIKASYTMLEKKTKELHFLANHDALTGLRNRHNIKRDFEKIVETCENFCVMLADVDDFKKINDTYGHTCGDRCLTYVADAIIKSVADDGIVCRWGGEEFLAILKLTAQEGYKRAEEMRQRLCEALLQTEGYTITISMTVGFATSHDTRDTEELIHLVDERLYKGKNKGKNQVVAE